MNYVATKSTITVFLKAILCKPHPSMIGGRVFAKCLLPCPYHGL